MAWAIAKAGHPAPALFDAAKDEVLARRRQFSRPRIERMERIFAKAGRPRLIERSDDAAAADDDGNGDDGRRTYDDDDLLDDDGFGTIPKEDLDAFYGQFGHARLD